MDETTTVTQEVGIRIDVLKPDEKGARQIEITQITKEGKEELEPIHLNKNSGFDIEYTVKLPEGADADMSIK